MNIVFFNIFHINYIYNCGGVPVREDRSTLFFFHYPKTKAMTFSTTLSTTLQSGLR